MPRIIEISLSKSKADLLLEQLPRIQGVCGSTRNRDAALDPPGDVVTVSATNDAARDIFAVLDELRVLEGGSIRTSEPKALLTSRCDGLLENESNETVWEEMRSLLRADTNVQHNYLILMTLAGAVAAVGLWMNALHLIIGAMVMAPAFEPLVRTTFGMVRRVGSVARRGLLSSVSGYVLMGIGGALSLLLLKVIDPEPRTLTDQQWVQHWSSTSPAGAWSSFLGAVAGAIVIAGLRSVLTTGVMITLALVPSMSLIGMALVEADLALFRGAALRWTIDVVVVLAVSAVVLALKQRFVHRATSR